MLVTEEIGPVHRGIDLFLPPWSDVLWSAVVLLIIAFAFYRFIMPKFMSVLDQRAQLIDGGIKQAEQVREAAQQTLVERHQMLEEAQVEAAKTRAAARAEGEAIIQQQREVAAQEVARIEENSKRNIEAQRQLAESELQAEVGNLAVELASKIIGDKLASDGSKSATVDQVIAELESSTLMHGADTGKFRGGFDSPQQAGQDAGDRGVISDIGGDFGQVNAIGEADQDLLGANGAGGGGNGGGVGGDQDAGPIATTVVKERHHFLRKRNSGSSRDRSNGSGG